MTYLYFIGSEQKYPWCRQERTAQRIINSARACFKRNRFNQLHTILKSLIKQGNPEALYIAANVSRPKETAERFNRRHLEFIKQSAAAEYPPALYTLGFYFDMGDAAPTIPRDQLRAAQIFKRGAELKHAHCQHLHATALLWGSHGIKIDIPAGLAYLRASADAKF